MITLYALWGLAVIGGMWVACALLLAAVMFADWLCYRRAVRRLVKYARLRDRSLTPTE